MLITSILLPDLLSPVALSLIASLIDSVGRLTADPSEERIFSRAKCGQEQPKSHPRGTKSDPRATRGGQRALLEAVPERDFLKRFRTARLTKRACAPNRDAFSGLLRV